MRSPSSQNEMSVATSGFIALMEYVSSPSSMGSVFFNELPDILISTGGRTQTQENNGDDPNLNNSKLLWITRPR